MRTFHYALLPGGYRSSAQPKASRAIPGFRDTLPATAPPKTPQARSDANVEALENELRAIKAQFVAAIDELDTRTEDMKSTTEEFQAVNRSYNPPTRSLRSKEELQSVNEELQTINSELND